MAWSLRGNGMGRTEILFLEEDGEEGAGKQGKRRFTGILRKLQALFCVLAEGALTVGALYGRKLNAAVLGLLVVVQIILWVLLRWRPGRTLGKRKREEYGRERSVPIGICFCAVASAALAAVLFRPAACYEAVYRAEGYAEVMLRNLRDGRSPDSSGTVNRGNQYRTGEVQLELAASQVPTEPLYLRGFAGGDYVGNGWDAADEEVLFDEVGRILDWEE